MSRGDVSFNFGLPPLRGLRLKWRISASGQSRKLVIVPLELEADNRCGGLSEDEVAILADSDWIVAQHQSYGAGRALVPCG